MRGRATWLMFIVAIGFGLVLSYPYTSLDADDSRLGVAGGPYFAVLLVHIFTAAVALVAGPLQFVAAVRAHRRTHRTLGRIYLLAGVLPAALTAIPVALWSGRPLTQFGLTTAAVLWLVTGVLAYRAARRRDFAEHRDWMTRNYALTFLAVTSRILVPLLLLAWIPLGGPPAGELGERAPSMIPIGQTAGWIINLIVAETIVRRRRGATSTADLQS
jgi:uncharacterized membrane protein YozB (DUF420 family)